MSPILTTADLTFASALMLFAAVTVICVAALKGWRDWIALKRDELAHAHGTGQDVALPNAASRIELADLRERLRKLEAIAAGVDL